MLWSDVLVLTGSGHPDCGRRDGRHLPQGRTAAFVVGVAE